MESGLVADIGCNDPTIAEEESQDAIVPTTIGERHGKIAVVPSPINAHWVDAAVLDDVIPEILVRIDHVEGAVNINLDGRCNLGNLLRCGQRWMPRKIDDSAAVVTTDLDHFAMLWVR
jgi:hypothetical protein